MMLVAEQANEARPKAHPVGEHRLWQEFAKFGYPDVVQGPDRLREANGEFEATPRPWTPPPLRPSVRRLTLTEVGV